MYTSQEGAPIYAPQPTEIPCWVPSQINLLNPRLGAKGLYASDEFFAPLERMLNPDPAVFIPGKFDSHGKWMDGWETRRKRTTGFDWSLIKLARTSNLRGFHLDTSHFTGNFAPAVGIEACLSASDVVEDLQKSAWQLVVPPSSLRGNSHQFVEMEKSLRKEKFSHLRVSLFPDGGLARLRAYGRPVLNVGVEETIDLIALENGGRAVAWNDAHYGAPANLLLPGKSLNMGDGWETRRRREPGNDWCLIALAAPGLALKIEVDTAFFKGNFADSCSIQAAFIQNSTDQSLITQSMFWPVLLPKQKLAMDQVFHFQSEIILKEKISHIRFNIFPDGGISRLRLFGHLV